MGEHTAGQAAVGPDPTQHPLPFPEAPRISDAGRGPQRKLRYQGFLEVNQGEDRERGRPSTSGELGFLTAQSRRLRTRGEET